MIRLTGFALAVSMLLGCSSSATPAAIGAATPTPEAGSSDDAGAPVTEDGGVTTPGDDASSPAKDAGGGGSDAAVAPDAGAATPDAGSTDAGPQWQWGCYMTPGQPNGVATGFYPFWDPSWPCNDPSQPAPPNVMPFINSTCGLDAGVGWPPSCVAPLQVPYVCSLATCVIYTTGKDGTVEAVGTATHSCTSDADCANMEPNPSSHYAPKCGGAGYCVNTIP